MDRKGSGEMKMPAGGKTGERLRACGAGSVGAGK